MPLGFTLLSELGKTDTRNSSAELLNHWSIKCLALSQRVDRPEALEATVATFDFTARS